MLVTGGLDAATIMSGIAAIAAVGTYVEMRRTRLLSRERQPPIFELTTSPSKFWPGWTFTQVRVRNIGPSAIEIVGVRIDWRSRGMLGRASELRVQDGTGGSDFPSAPPRDGLTAHVGLARAIPPLKPDAVTAPYVQLMISPLRRFGPGDPKLIVQWRWLDRPDQRHHTTIAICAPASAS